MLCDRVAVDPELLRERPDGGQQLAGAEGAGRRRDLHLVDQLQVDSFGRFEIKLEDHVTVI
jgi:hypothetical protein